MQEFPLYCELQKFSRANKSEYQTEEEANKQLQAGDGQEEELQPHVPRKLSRDPVAWQDRGWRCNYDFSLKPNQATRKVMLVDEIFALYLYTVSLKTNPIFYRIVLMFVVLYRECFNHIGWTKRLAIENIDIVKNPDIETKMKQVDYCLSNTAEHAPDICNEFVTVWMVDHKEQSKIDRQDCIDLTINFCHWLFENQFTCSKLAVLA